MPNPSKMRSITMTHMSSVFVMILAYLIYTSAKGGKFGYKQTFVEGISSNISLDTPFGPLRGTNCAHTLIDGDIIITLNQWPYNIEVDVCDFALEKGETFCPIKKGETYSFTFKVTMSSLSLYKGHYVGKATVSNSYDEVLLCLSLDIKLP
ncbi:uncharacterized protein [Amphiura filiformis]|uniref:uncharacterized protein isoform X2 n=1 Tax=Amphiura filiformis TaxID=82378 RepID=UPI003B2217B5